MSTSTRSPRSAAIKANQFVYQHTHHGKKKSEDESTTAAAATVDMEVDDTPAKKQTTKLAKQTAGGTKRKRGASKSVNEDEVEELKEDKEEEEEEKSNKRPKRSIKKRVVDADEDEVMEEHIVRSPVRKSRKSPTKKSASTSGSKKSTTKKTTINKKKKSIDEMDEREEEENDEDELFSSEDEEEPELSDAESRADDWQPEDDSDNEDDEGSEIVSVAVPKPGVKLPPTSFMDLLDSPHANEEQRLMMVLVALKDPNFNINQQSSVTGNTFIMICYSLFPNELRTRTRHRVRTPFPYERVAKETDITLKNNAGQNLLHWICANAGRSVPLFKKMFKLCCGWKMSLVEPDNSGLTPLHALAKNKNADKNLWFNFFRPRSLKLINLGLLDHTHSTPLHYLFEQFSVHYDNGWSYKLLTKLSQTPKALSQLSPYDTNDSGASIFSLIKSYAESRLSNSTYSYYRHNHTQEGWSDVPHKFELAWQHTVLPTIEKELTPHLIHDLMNITTEYLVGEKPRTKSPAPADEEEKKTAPATSTPSTQPISLAAAAIGPPNTGAFHLPTQTPFIH